MKSLSLMKSLICLATSHALRDLVYGWALPTCSSMLWTRSLPTKDAEQPSSSSDRARSRSRSLKSKRGSESNDQKK